MVTTERGRASNRSPGPETLGVSLVPPDAIARVCPQRGGFEQRRFLRRTRNSAFYRDMRRSRPNEAAARRCSCPDDRDFSSPSSALSVRLEAGDSSRNAADITAHAAAAHARSDGRGKMQARHDRHVPPVCGSHRCTACSAFRHPPPQFYRSTTHRTTSCTIPYAPRNDAGAQISIRTMGLFHVTVRPPIVKVGACFPAAERSLRDNSTV